MSMVIDVKILYNSVENSIVRNVKKHILYREMAFIMKEMKMKIVYYKGSFNKNCLQGELQGNLEV